MNNSLPKKINKDRVVDSTNNRGKQIKKWGAILACALCFMALGGLMGIVFQPPGLKAFLRTFHIGPGSGTSNPMAISIKKMHQLEQETTLNKINNVVALGTILPMSEVITIGLPYGANDSTIDTITVKQGDKVKKGQVLAVLDSYPELSMEVRQTKNTVEVKKAIVRQTINQVLANQAETGALLEKAQAKALNEHNEYDRIHSLFEKKFISKSQLDLQFAKKDQAEKEISQAKANRSRYESEDIETQVDVLVALKNLNVSQSEYEMAQTKLRRSEIRASLDGTILDVLAFEGEKPSSEGVFVIGNLDTMIVRAEIFQTDIGKVSMGDKATIKAVSLKDELEGQVIKIGLKVKKQTRVFDNPSAQTDARVIEVDIILNKQSSEIAARYTNMQVVAMIKVGHRQ
jgi:HlyD family secretion protein